MKRLLCGILILLFVFPFSLCACSDKAKPEDTIKKMETAMNTYDIDKLVECYEPSVQSVYSGIMEVLNLFGDVDFRTVIQALGGVAYLYGDNLTEDGVPKVSITVNSIKEIEEDRVLADLTFEYTYKDKTKKQPSERSYLYLVYIDDTWYLEADVPKVASQIED